MTHKKLSEYHYFKADHIFAIPGDHYLIPAPVAVAADAVMEYAIHLSDVSIPNDFEWWAKFREALDKYREVAKDG